MIAIFRHFAQIRCGPRNSLSISKSKSIETISSDFAFLFEFFQTSQQMLDLYGGIFDNRWF